MGNNQEKTDIKLTKNDKKVLHYLIEHARISDSATAKKIGVTPQAILKIRNKLENAGIIEGYSPRVNYKKLGVNVMAWAIVKFLPSTWSEYSEAEIREKIIKHKYIIRGCRIPESEATHILLYGFKNMKQMDEHFLRVQTKLAKIIEIKRIYSFSVEQIIKDSPEGLFHIILDEKEFLTSTLFEGSSLLKKKKS